jgi:predicted nucleic acid-binding protein
MTQEQISEIIEIGQRFDVADMVDQLEYSLVLASRDRKILARCGWLESDGHRLQVLRDELKQKAQKFQKVHGQIKAEKKSILELIGRAKRWRLQALAIGRNGLSGEARRKLECLSRPTYSNPRVLAEVIQALLEAAEHYREAFAGRGAPTSFLHDGQAVLDDLHFHLRGEGETQAEMTPHAQPSDARHAARELQELCGHAWCELKKLNRSGRAAQLLAGNRQRAMEYNLDILLK